MPELRLNRQQIVVQEFEDLFPVNGCRCTQSSRNLFHPGVTESRRKPFGRLSWLIAYRCFASSSSPDSKTFSPCLCASVVNNTSNCFVSSQTAHQSQTRAP